MPKVLEALNWGHVKPSGDTRWTAFPNGDKTAGGDGYEIDFTLHAAENPVSDGGIWVNNEQGGGGNAAMESQASLQIDLASDDITMILMHGDDDAVDYKDPFGFVPGISGNQRVVVKLYRLPGYNPGTNHEWHIWLGAIVYGTNDKRCVAVTLGANGVSEIALHNGTLSGYNILGNLVTALQPDTDDEMIAELDRVAKTIKLWLKKGTDAPVLLNQISWSTTGGSITTQVKGWLEDLGDGAGCGAYKPPGGSIRSYGAKKFRMESFP